MSIDIKTHSEAETIALGAFLGPLLEDGQTIALRGDLAPARLTLSKHCQGDGD
mgnify:CR=1 FL=1